MRMKLARRGRVVVCGLLVAPLILACGAGSQPTAAPKEERAAETRATTAPATA
ncbi:MAG: hypothetical protein H0V51_04765, partial [Chloroflexi bacterium]|nr:hypothetical protein [Chloroflexota bacterium]